MSKKKKQHNHLQRLEQTRSLIFKQIQALESLLPTYLDEMQQRGASLLEQDFNRIFYLGYLLASMLGDDDLSKEITDVLNIIARAKDVGKISEAQRLRMESVWRSSTDLLQTLELDEVEQLVTSLLAAERLTSSPT